ncbi:MAG: HNH endonuclease [Aquabacterium sp.]
MNPFFYPKYKHTRTQKPKQYLTYQAYKPVLRGEFRRKCVYCLTPDTNFPRQDGYGVDHYRPKSLFSDLATDYSNLYYCCNPCNSRKGDYWPNKVDENRLFIPNPCDHEMFRHLRFSGSVVEHRSEAGELAVKLLDLNDPKVIRFRQSITEMVDVFSKKLAQMETTHAKLCGIADKGHEKRDELLADIGVLEADMANTRRVLEQLTGQPIPQ